MPTESQNMDELLEEVHASLPAISAWLYIAIWTFSEMALRARGDPSRLNFSNLTFPHTDTPLFTPEQAASLEELWTSQQNSQEQQNVHRQAGGFLNLQRMSETAEKLGKKLADIPVDENTFSIDAQYKKVTGILDGLDDGILDLSKKYGLIALESVAPDPKFVIPTPIPIPIMFSVRLVLPILNTLLEILRIGSTLNSYTNFLVKPTTFLMALLDLGRGNFYHAIFTLLGFWGTYPLYAGVVLKVLRDAYLLISPDIRTEARDIVFKSGKSFVAGFMIWLFGLVSPEFVRRPVQGVLDKLQVLIDRWNTTMDTYEKRMIDELGPDAAAGVTMPRIPPSQTPTISDLYILQQYIHSPLVYCQPEIAPLIAEMRAIPPLALFFDLTSIPDPASPAFAKACSELAEGKSAGF